MADDARIWQAADLGGVELLRATLTGFAFSPHAHENFFIALTEGGVATPRYRGDSHVVGAGDLIVLNPEEPHAGGTPPGSSWAYRALYPRPELLRDLLQELPGARPAVPTFRGDVLRDPAVTAGLRRFHRLAERPGSSLLARETYLVEALVRLVGRYAVPPRTVRRTGHEPRAVRLSREYLDEHAGQQVPLGVLARIAGLSHYHLCRVFREAVGMPPHAYQTQLRVRRAKALLREGMPIARAATEMGFYDQAHLTRHFKRIVGLPPGQYHRSVSGDGEGAWHRSRWI